MLKKTFDKWWADLEKVINELPVTATEKPRRETNEMLEEILNSVRALSNMISEQSWRRYYISPESLWPSLADIYRMYRARTGGSGAGIGGRSTGPAGLEPSEAVRLAAELLSASASPSPSPSEEYADDKKKTE